MTASRSTPRALGAAPDLGQHRVERVDEIADLVVRGLPDAQREVAPLDHLARDVGHREDRARERALQDGRQEQREREARDQDETQYPHVIAQPRVERIGAAQVHGAEHLLILDDPPEYGDLFVVDHVTVGLRCARKARTEDVDRAVAREQPSGRRVDRGCTNLRLHLEDAEIVSRRIRIVEYQRSADARPRICACVMRPAATERSYVRDS